MRYITGVPGRFGVRSACMVLLWVAMTTVSTGSAYSRGLSAISDGVAGARKHSGLIVPATQLDFAARDLRVEPGIQIPLSLRLPTVDQLKSVNSEVGTFILVRNISEGLSFSEGMPIGTNWVMSLPQASRARLGASNGTVGNHRLEFLLIGSGNRVLAETSVIARLSEPTTPTSTGVEQPVAAIARTIEPEKRQAQPAAPATKATVSREDEAILLAKGAELVGQGGIAAARLMFEELAQQGSSQGALAMARTYDPAYIAAAPTGSITPEVPKALAWYKRAAELGSGEAGLRISQLASQR
jgi:hypothetical protein